MITTRRPAAVASMVLLLTLVAAAAAPAASSSSSAAAAAGGRRAQLQRVLAQLSRSRQRLREVRRQERRVLWELEDIDRTKEAAEQRLSELSVDLRRSRFTAQATAARLGATEHRLADHRARVRGRLRDVYKYGRTGYADVLFGAEEFGEFVTRWHFVTTIARADGRRIAEYQEDLEEYRALQLALQREQTQIQTISADTEARRREIFAKEQAKRAMLTRLQVERAAYERMVRELQENSRAIELLIRRVQRRTGPPPALARSLRAFIWPARGVFTSGFGLRRHPIFGIRRMHTGVDIGARRGAPVQAAADGRVIYTGWFGGYGKIIVLDHGGGLSTLYAHLSQILTQEGRSVRQGAVIGRVGSTGYSTGPHVHFEVRVNGRPIDPTRR